MLTMAEMVAAAAAADDRARRARAQSARLRREIARAAAAREGNRERAVGRLLIAWCTSDERVRGSTAAYLRGCAEREPDLRPLLAGSVLDLDPPPTTSEQ